MPPSADYAPICVPPDLVPQVWPHVWEMLKKAIDKTDYGTFQALEDDVFAGSALLWIVWQEPKIVAAVVTQLVTNERSRACYILGCGCTQHRAWQSLMPPVEAYARSAHCNKIRLLGRKGWERLFPDARVSLYVIEKDLN